MSINPKKRNIMKARTMNATVGYDPEVISESTNIHFTKVTNASGTTIYGKIEKNGAEAGNISHETKGDYLITTLKPYSGLTADEVKGIYEAVPRCIAELTEA